MSSAPFFGLSRFSMGCETFTSKLQLKVRDRITQNRQLKPKSACLHSGGPAHIGNNVYPHSVIRLRRGVTQLRQLADPQTGQTSPLAGTHCWAYGDT